MSFWRKTWLLAVGGTVAILLLGGCSSADETPTPTAGLQAAPTVQPTPKPTVTSAAAPTLPVDEAPATIAAYAAARDRALVLGREAAGLVTAGKLTTLHQRFTPAFKSALPEEAVRDAFDSMMKNVVRFEAPELGASFLGQLKGNEISGPFNGDVGEFHLRRNTAGDSDETLDQIAGHWEGAIDIGGMGPGIMVDLADDGAGLRGTITIPEFGVEAMPLSLVSYHSSLTIGERIAEMATPGTYGAEHAWGGGSLLIALSLDSDGMLEGILLAPSPRLPSDPRVGYQTRAKLRLPFSELWVVAAAGPTVLTNHHVVSRSERHAYDLNIWKDGKTHHSSGSLNEHYWAWGEPVLSPADGTVTAVRDGLEDSGIGVTNEDEPAGNHVVLDLGNSEYLLIAHLQKGSVRVDLGDTVVAGQVLGLTGSSGRSAEPHIHIHLQDGPDILSDEAIGLPLLFSNYERDGEAVSLGTLAVGQLVRPIVQ